MTAPIYNELIKQISQHSKEPGVIFKLFESVKDYEGIFRLILEEEFKTYEKSKNEEIRNDPKVMAEIAFKFKFLEDSLKNYRFNSQSNEHVIILIF